MVFYVEDLQTVRVLLLLFQSGFPLFIYFFSSLIPWLGLLKLYWIAVARVGTLVPDFRGKAFNFSPLRIMFAVGLSYMAFIMLRYVPSMPAFCFLNHKWMVNFAKSCLCIYWDNHMVFIFQYVNVVYHIDWFANIKESLHPWDKAHLVIMYDLFNMLLASVC